MENPKCTILLLSCSAGMSDIVLILPSVRSKSLSRDRLNVCLLTFAVRNCGHARLFDLICKELFNIYTHIFTADALKNKYIFALNSLILLQQYPQNVRKFTRREDAVFRLTMATVHRSLAATRTRTTSRPGAK